MKIEYIYRNPVRLRLLSYPGDWRYSILRGCFLDDDGVFRVDGVEML